MSSASSASIPSADIVFRILLAANAADMQSVHCAHTDTQLFIYCFSKTLSVCLFDHLLPGNLSQLPIVLDDSPQENVSARVPLRVRTVLL